ncbi:OmpA family protein [Permianibacter sp. IMCC34836]|uniref:MotB family protein n=1 Tax=Permianibacter fluminis TaxID=2738515 RepID=UPI001555D89A|nr:MotB family protein [Permianibacter fluminis]NQD36890.1 OmpA family protein [Permianibacter fluminis]
MFDDEEEGTATVGAPSWMVTFADLMSLLLCFFVLLLSFSTMDAERFKAIAESLQASLGVETVTLIANPPPLTITEPLPTDSRAEEPAPVEPPTTDSSPNTTEPPSEPSDANPVTDLTAAQLQLAAREQAETEQLAQDLANSLHDEIVANRIELLAEGRTITLRIRENGSFPSGDAALQAPVRPVLARIRERLAATTGHIEVAGHTDNQPIETDRYRSNWELSSARAVSVAHELMQGGSIPPARLIVSGHADTMPLASNDREEGRARNRRVEIVVRR